MRALAIGSMCVLVACASGSPPNEPDRIGEAEASRADQLRLAAIRVNDVASASAMAAEGEFLYLGDRRRVDGYEYCRRSIELVEQGEFRLAIREAQKALFLGRRDGDPDVIGHAARDLAYAYLLAGDLDQADAWAREAVRNGRMRTRNSAAILTGAHSTLGAISLLRGDSQEARRQFQTALAELSSADFEDERAARRSSLNASLARTALLEGDFDDATRLLALADRTATEEQRPYLARTRGDLARAEGDHVAAKQYYATSIAGGDLYHQFWAHAGLARADLALGNVSAAIESYRNAIDTAERVRARFRSEEFKVGVFGEMQAIFDETIGVLVDAGRSEEAFAVSEQSRARAALDLVGGRVVVSARDQAVTETRTRALALDSIQAALPADTTLLQFHVTDDATYAWIVDRSSSRSIALDIGRESLARDGRALRQALADGADASLRANEMLRSALLDPLDLPRGDSLVIVPHGPLHELPFHALSEGGRYLIEDRAVSYALSASILHDLTGRASPSATAAAPRLLALGNPDLGDPSLDLPGAEAEVRAIVGTGTGGELHVRQAATEALFRDRAGETPVVHVAAHAVVDEIDPLFSTVLLAPSDGFDGIVEAHDFYRLDLAGNEMVVLSGCDTGVGRVRRSDDVFGFMHTLHGAGAETIVATLWPIDDTATGILMSTFYEALENRPVAIAMRDAQVAAIREHGLPTSVWAAFIVFGSPF